MRRPAMVVCALLLVSSMLPAFAGDRLGVGVKAGTLGLGVDLTGRINNWVSVRGTLNGGSLSRSINKDDVDYDGDLTVGAAGVLVDFHPFRGNFRLTGGLMRNRNKIELTATPTNNVDIGDTTYSPAEVGTLRGKVEFEKTVPYFGIGFGNAAKSPGRIKFLFDAGIMEQGSGDVTLDSSRNVVTKSDLRKEASNVEDDISNVKIWPVLAFGISFRI